MKELELYRPLTLSDEEHESLGAIMVEAFKAMSHAAMERYGFANVKKLRREYKAKRSILAYHPWAKQSVMALEAVEHVIVRAYIRLGTDLCRKFDRSEYPGVSIGDYFQECAMALYDCAYLYNGSTKFTTYATWSMKNRLVSFVRQEKLGRMNRVPCDESIPAPEPVPVDEEMAVWTQTVEDAKLSDMQRRLVVARMTGDAGFVARIAATEINPNTGKLWTKQRLSQVFIEACEIIRDGYNKSHDKLAA